MTRGQINKIKDKGFGLIGLIATLSGLIILGFFIGQILHEGLNRLDMDFMKDLPSRGSLKSTQAIKPITSSSLTPKVGGHSEASLSLIHI